MYSPSYMATYITSREAAKVLGVHPNTLRKYADSGKIDIIKISNQRRYNVDKYIADNNLKPSNKRNIKICYCRVSSSKQKADLQRQVNSLKAEYPEHLIITDVSSGLNNKRPGLKKILEYSCRKTLAEVVVAHKDRLSRFGFDLIEQVVNLNGGRILVQNNHEFSKEQELSKDIVSIITVFAAKIHGSRRYKRKSKNNNSESDEESEEEVNSMDG